MALATQTGRALSGSHAGEFQIIVSNLVRPGRSC
jgi:hypothetical protein